MTQASATQQLSDKNEIRPFQVSFPDEELTELRRRIKATKQGFLHSLTFVPIRSRSFFIYSCHNFATTNFGY